LKRCLILGYGQRENGRIDEQIEDRCRKALRMYRNGKIEKIYLTVSASKNGVSMASAMRDFLVEQGVRENNIIVEQRGRNTAGEMEVFLSLVPTDERVVFVSTWYHIPRILWLALWRVRLTHFALGVAWRHAHFKADVLIEFLKFANAILRPRSSAKVLSVAPSPS